MATPNPMQTQSSGTNPNPAPAAVQTPNAGEGNSNNSNVDSGVSEFESMFGEMTGNPAPAAKPEGNQNPDPANPNPPAVTTPPVVETPPVQQTTPVQTPAQTPEQIQQQWQQQDQAFTQALEKHYTIPPDAITAAGFTPEQAAFLSKGMAQVHKSAYQHLLADIGKILPQVFDQQYQRVQGANSAEAQFKAAYPKIDYKNPDHINMVRTAGHAVNLANQGKNLSVEARSKLIGELAYTMLGFGNAQAQNNVPVQTPNEPAPNVRSMGSGGSQGNLPTQNNQDKNEFEDMFNELTKG